MEVGGWSASSTFRDIIEDEKSVKEIEVITYTIVKVIPKIKKNGESEEDVEGIECQIEEVVSSDSLTDSGFDNVDLADDVEKSEVITVEKQKIEIRPINAVKSVLAIKSCVVDLHNSVDLDEIKNCRKCQRDYVKTSENVDSNRRGKRNRVKKQCSCPGCGRIANKKFKK